LNYRTGDEFSQAAKGRSNDVLVFLDSDGRSYNAAAHTLPSARGQGEPLSGRFKAKNDARFVGVLMGNADAKVLLVSNAGFGFVGTLSEMVTKNKAGKACLSVPSGGYALPPLLIDPALHASDDAQVAAVTNQGRLLVFALKDLPELARGKGNKLLNVPSADFKSGEEELVGAVALGEKDELLVHAGQRHLRLKSKDLENYIGERARRGRKLPRGFQKVERLSVE
jgi:topoisomerase-4 subunit A